jgi:hypothetical protein
MGKWKSVGFCWVFWVRWLLEAGIWLVCFLKFGFGGDLKGGGALILQSVSKKTTRQYVGKTPTKNRLKVPP